VSESCLLSSVDMDWRNAVNCSTNHSEELSLLVQLLYHAILMQHECYCIETTHSLVHNAGYALEKHRFSLVVHLSFMYQYCVTYCLTYCCV